MKEEYLAGLKAKRFADVSEVMGDSDSSENVEVLDLSHNELQTLSDFPAMPKLVDLRLISNMICSLAPQNIAVFESLVTLDV